MSSHASALIDLIAESFADNVCVPKQVFHIANVKKIMTPELTMFITKIDNNERDKVVTVTAHSQPSWTLSVSVFLMEHEYKQRSA